MKKTNDIAIILPTRGFIFTEVAMAIENMRHNTWMRIRVYMSHNRPIPCGINELVDEALQDPNTSHLLFIEEDTVPPAHALNKLIQTIADISFIDYGVNGWSCSARHHDTGNILWCGLGCTLVKRHVFKELDKPYFRTDKKFRLNTCEWVDAVGTNIYGGQDIWFFLHAREKGFKIEQIEGECKHLKLDSLGQVEINKGIHTISQKPPIEKLQIIELGGGEDYGHNTSRIFSR